MVRKKETGRRKGAVATLTGVYMQLARNRHGRRYKDADKTSGSTGCYSTGMMYRLQHAEASGNLAVGEEQELCVFYFRRSSLLNLSARHLVPSSR